jgi:hypothetical protein
MPDNWGAGGAPSSGGASKGALDRRGGSIGALKVGAITRDAGRDAGIDERVVERAISCTVCLTTRFSDFGAAVAKRGSGVGCELLTIGRLEGARKGVVGGAPRQIAAAVGEGRREREEVALLLMVCASCVHSDWESNLYSGIASRGNRRACARRVQGVWWENVPSGDFRYTRAATAAPRVKGAV